MSEIRSVLKHSAIYGLGTLLARVTGFIMLPVYTRFLAPADYGVLELLSMLTILLTVLVGAGMSQAVSRFYYHVERPEQRRLVVSTALVLFGTIFLVVSGISVFFAPAISSFVFGSTELTPLVRIAVLDFLFRSTIEIPFSYLKAKQDSTRYIIISTCRLFVNLFLNILFLVGLGLGVAGIVYGSFLSGALTGMYLTATTIRETGLRFSAPVARSLLAFGIPLILAGVSSFTIAFSDRYFLQLFWGLQHVGLYSIAVRVAGLAPALLSAPFAMIWAPKVMEIHATASGKETIREVFRLFNVAFVFLLLTLSLFGSTVLRVMTERSYWDAAGVVPVIALALLFAGYRQFARIGFWVRMETRPIAVIVASSALLNVVGNIVLIPWLGIWGAAWATVGAHVFEFAVSFRLSQRRYAVDYARLRLLIPPVGAVAVYLLVDSVVADVHGVLSLLVRSSGLVVFSTIVIVTGVFPWQDCRRVIELLRHPRRAVGAFLRA